MRKAGLGVALVATAAMLQAGPVAASRACYSKAELEAEQAIRFQTDLMVVSSACQNQIYGEFRQRNQYAIIRYQKQMIDYFRHAGARQPARNFETWITHLANQEAIKESDVPTADVCRHAADLLKLAGTLDPKGFHQLAAARAAADPGHPRCGK